MSKFRDIWAQAILAGQQMMRNPQLGDRPFGQLLSKYPQDGMIFYERGEAFEYLNELERAERDYAEAERLLPLPHWKLVARRALARVQGSRCPEDIRAGEQSLQWKAFHDVHAVPHAPHKVRVRALSALARIDSELRSALTDLRSCLEELVVCRLRRAHTVLPSDLEGKIRLAELSRIAPANIVENMHQLRQIGNSATHTGGTLESRDVDSAIRALVLILRWSASE